MANTVTHGPGVIQIIPDAGTDFDITSYFPNGVELMGVKFMGSDSGDLLYIRSRTAAGPYLVTKLTADDSFGWIKPLHCFPYIYKTDCTLNTPGNVVITLYVY